MVGCGLSGQKRNQEKGGKAGRKPTDGSKAGQRYRETQKETERHRQRKRKRSIRIDDLLNMYDL